MSADNKWFIPDVLTRLDDRPGQIVWAQVGVPLLDMWANPDEQRRASQIVADSWVQLLSERQGYTLVRSEDMTLGWVESNALAQHESPDSPWVMTKAKIGELTEATPQEEIEDLISDYIGKPYLLGGISEQGLDCSALVQHWYGRRWGLLLPKHSWNQKKYGIHVEPDDLQPEDLVFAVSRKPGRKHVGIYLGDDQVYHSTKRKEAVVIWDMELFDKIYETVECRRIVQDRNANLSNNDIQ